MLGDTALNQHGRVIADVVLNNRCAILNIGSYTHFHFQTGTHSCVDLTLCSPELMVDMSWETMTDLCGSDHYPIFIKEMRREALADIGRYIINKVDWHLYNVLTYVPEQDWDRIDVNKLMATFTEVVEGAANLEIPKRSGNGRHTPVPWWKRECQYTHNDRKRDQHRYQRTRSVQDKISLNRASAIARYTERKSQKQSCQD